jgi:single-strand DNA-binding protein
MPSLNKVILIGRVVRDPELRYTSAGKALVAFRIAVDRIHKNQDGTKKTDFFRCTAWDKTAEFVTNYVLKGCLVAIDGRIELNEQVVEGVTKYYTDIVCDKVEKLDSTRSDDGAGAPPAETPPAAQSPRASARPAARPAPRPAVPAGDDEFDDFDDDPFADE